jgi:hypothetical protein
MPNANIDARSAHYGASESERYVLAPARPLTPEERREDNERQKADEK